MRRALTCALACALLIGGCARPFPGEAGGSASAGRANATDSTSPASSSTEMTVIFDDAVSSEDTEPDDRGTNGSTFEVTFSDEEQSESYSRWSEAAAPEYYLVIGASHINQQLEPGTVSYTPLDELHRAGRATACITYEMMEAGRARERQDISELHPSGWGHNAEATITLSNGSTYHGMFWNRSHLIAKSLGGADELENLVTGTRMQNVGSNSRGGSSGGMAYAEGLARSWLEAHPTGSIMYVATPVYEGSELVCRSVLVDLLSSDGSLDLRIEVFNAAKGFDIDYATGEFWETR